MLRDSNGPKIAYYRRNPPRVHQCLTDHNAATNSLLALKPLASELGSSYNYCSSLMRSIKMHRQRSRQTALSFSFTEQNLSHVFELIEVVS